MTFFLTPVLMIAAVGLILSLIVHLAAVLGIDLHLGEKVFILHVGLPIVWIPTILVFNKMTKDCKRSELWKVALKGCPDWMRKMVYVFFGYAIFNFAIFAIISNQRGDFHGAAPPEVVKGFSGHWMVFYSAALAVIYSAKNLKLDEIKCRNGHPVSPLAKYCEECGELIK